MTSRLALVDHQLAERILAADPAVCRRAAAAAAGWANRAAGLDDPRVDVLLICDAAPTTNVAVAREALRALVDELDEAGWDLQDQVEEGTALDDDYLRAFGKARAASALYEATEEDPRLAALDAVCEAWMVVDDPARSGPSSSRRLTGGDRATSPLAVRPGSGEDGSNGRSRAPRSQSQSPAPRHPRSSSERDRLTNGFLIRRYDLGCVLLTCCVLVCRALYRANIRCAACDLGLC